MHVYTAVNECVDTLETKYRRHKHRCVDTNKNGRIKTTKKRRVDTATKGRVDILKKRRVD